MEDDLLNGDGDVADFTAQYGDQLTANQNIYDAADNGTLTTTNGVATYTPPSWLTSLSGLVNAGATVAGTVGTTVKTFTNQPSSTSAANATKANTSKTGSSTASSLSSFLPWIIGGAVALLLGFILLRKS